MRSFIGSGGASPDARCSNDSKLLIIVIIIMIVMLVIIAILMITVISIMILVMIKQNNNNNNDNSNNSAKVGPAAPTRRGRFRRRQTCYFRQLATSAPAESRGEMHNVSRNRARTQVLLQVQRSHVYGSGTFGAFFW